MINEFNYNLPHLIHLIIKKVEKIIMSTCSVMEYTVHVVSNLQEGWLQGGKEKEYALQETSRIRQIF